MQHPRVGVIITTRNRCEILRHTLERTFEQAYPNFTVAVFDDASSDGSSEMIRSQFPLVRVDRSDPARGYIVNRNRAAELLSDCDYLVSLDDDSWLLRPDALSRVVELFQKHPNTALLSFEIFGSYHLPLPPEIELEGHEIASFAGCGYAIDRKQFVQLGGFPEFFEFYGEENDFIMRAMDADLTCRFAPSVPVYHAETLVGRNEDRIREFSLANTLTLFWLREPLFVCIPHATYVFFHRALRWGMAGHFASFRAGMDRFMSRFSTISRSRKPIRFSTLRKYRALQKRWGSYIYNRRMSSAPRSSVALPPSLENR